MKRQAPIIASYKGTSTVLFSTSSALHSHRKTGLLQSIREAAAAARNVTLRILVPATIIDIINDNNDNIVVASTETQNEIYNLKNNGGNNLKILTLQISEKARNQYRINFQCS